MMAIFRLRMALWWSNVLRRCTVPHHFAVVHDLAKGNELPVFETMPLQSARRCFGRFAVFVALITCQHIPVGGVDARKGDRRLGAQGTQGVFSIAGF